MFHQTGGEGTFASDADRVVDPGWYDDQRLVSCRRCGLRYAFGVVPTRCPRCNHTTAR
jgi:hypothetical protein